MNAKELADFLHGSPRRVHLIGVAGSGMSGIAGLLLALGHRISGSDKVDTAEVRRLQSLGLDFKTCHGAADVADAIFLPEPHDVSAQGSAGYPDPACSE